MPLSQGDANTTWVSAVVLSGVGARFYFGIETETRASKPKRAHNHANAYAEAILPHKKTHTPEKHVNAHAKIHTFAHASVPRTHTDAHPDTRWDAHGTRRRRIGRSQGRRVTKGGGGGDIGGYCYWDPPSMKPVRLKNTSSVRESKL